MNLKSFLKFLKKSNLVYNRNVVEYYRFVITDPFVKCTIRRINKKKILWSVHYLGERNQVHPQGKKQLKSGVGINSLKFYLENNKGVKFNGGI